MSSASPGHVNVPGNPEDGLSATPDTAETFARAAVSPVRAPAQKRARASPTTPARARAMAMIGTITDTVRAGAVRGLRAITDSIEKPRDDLSTSGSSDSGPPSPTSAVRAVSATPHGKRRRTALTDAHTRRTHADWRGSRWDYSSAMRDRNLHRVGDTGPSLFAFPDDRPIAGDGSEGVLQAQEAIAKDDTRTRPPSAMSAASAPAALSTPHSQPWRGEGGAPHSDGSDDRGWIVAAARPDLDPFAIHTEDPGEPMDYAPSAAEEGELGDEPFVRAIRAATALLSHDAVNSPDACGALLAFQARLRMHDPYGNFTSPPSAGDSAPGELRELRRMVEDLAAAQRACTETLRALAAQQSASTHPGLAPAEPDLPRGHSAGPCSPAARGTVRGGGDSSAGAVVSPAAGQPSPADAAAVGPGDTAAPDAGDSDALQRAGKGVGRHDPRRAVFRPAKPFGGRIPAAATADDVRDLNASSYTVRDAVNAALRDAVVARMDESTQPVQVAGVNWTERGNLCMIVDEGFTAAHLILQADVAAEAAALGAGWKASRDVPIHKAVLRNVPTRRVDGTLFTEEEILGDLRAHSVAFKTLPLADSAEQANWIATANERARKKRLTLVVNFATAGAAKRFMTMRHCLYALGCACEPGEFQPRERERICRTCWNPLARHRERDFRCRVRCRLCGGGHAEEDHTCHACDVLARPCVHIPLKCVNCGRVHAADDGACVYRRSLRGANTSAPPMSAGTGTGAGKGAAAAAAEKGRKKKRVRILEPHEPFPDDVDPAAPIRAPSPPPALPTPAQGTLAQAAPASSETPSAPRTTGATKRRRKRAGNKGDARDCAIALAASEPSTSPATPSPELAPEPTPAEQVGLGSPHGREEVVAGSPVMTAADDLAVEALVGAAPEPVEPAGLAEHGVTPGRRVAPPRGAAAEFDRDGRRRCAARVLAGAFRFLQVPEAIAALRRCSDDYASAVSWADEEQNNRRKPGMQGKTAASLQKLVADMTAAAATHKPAKATDPAAPPADE